MKHTHQSAPIGASHVTTAPIAPGDIPEPEFVNVPRACYFVGLGRTTLYENFDFNGGAIRTALIRRPGGISGKRLVHLASLREFLRSHMEPVAEEVVR